MTSEHSNQYVFPAFSISNLFSSLRSQLPDDPMDGEEENEFPTIDPFSEVELLLDVTNFDETTRVVTHLDIKPPPKDMPDDPNYSLRRPVPHFDDSMDYAEFAHNMGIPIVKYNLILWKFK